MTLLDTARRAVELDDTGRLVEAVLANSRGFASSIGEVDEEKLTFLEIALDRLASDQVERALVLATICLELTYGGAVERRSALADEAIEIARAAGDDVAVVQTELRLVAGLQAPMWLDRCRELIVDAAVRVQRIGDPALVALVDDCRGNIATWSGDVALLDRILASQQSAADRAGDPFLRWTLAMHEFAAPSSQEIATWHSRAPTMPCMWEPRETNRKQH